MNDSILRDIQDKVPRCTYHVNIGIGHLVDALDQYHVNLNPDYQRDHVWTPEQKRLFVGAMLENSRAIPPFWFNWTNKEFKHSDSEIVDGKQRLNALVDWLRGKIKAKCPCGVEVHYNDLTEIDHRNISSGVLMDWNFVDLDQKEVMEFYLRLNSGGTIHTEQELNKVKDLLINLDA